MHIRVFFHLEELTVFKWIPPVYIPISTKTIRTSSKALDYD